MSVTVQAGAAGAVRTATLDATAEERLAIVGAALTV
jgi:hypothetical protein